MGLEETLDQACGVEIVIVFLLALAMWIVIKMLMLRASESKPGWVLLAVVPLAGGLCLWIGWHQWGAFILGIYILTAIVIVMERRRNKDGKR
jgi:uncharacterized membrane protein